MAWLTGWSYRKSKATNPSTGAGTGYVIPIKVYKGSGTDGNETVDGLVMGKVYCGGNCKDDFGDIRFTSNDGTTLLDYWIDPDFLSSGTSAVFWVEVADSLESSSVTIYIYYDKPDATDVSNGAATFLFFDPFDNLNNWSASAGSPEVTGGELLLQINNSFEGVKKAWTTETCQYEYKFRPHSIPAGWKQAYFYFRRDGGANARQRLSNRIESAQAWIGDEGITMTIKNYTWVIDQNYHIRITRKNNTIYGYISKNGALELTSNQGTSNNSTVDVICLEEADDNNGVYIDNFRIRKFTSPEPVHSTWGSEEQPQQNYTETLTEYLGCLDSKSRVASRYRIFADYIGNLDTKTRIINLYRSFNEYLGALDSKISNKVRYLERSIIEYIGTIDSKVRLSKRFRVFIDNLGALDSKTRIAKRFRVFTDILGNFDSISKSLIRHLQRTIIEYLGSVDSIVHTWVRPPIEWVREIVEYLGVKDKHQRLYNWFRNLFKYKGKEHPRQKVSRT